MDSANACQCIALCNFFSAAKVQRFRKGYLVDRRQEDSPIYSPYGPTVTPLSGVPSPPGGKRHLSASNTGGSRPVSITSAVHLDLAAQPTGSLPGPACA